MHTVSFYWFLSAEWIIYLESYVNKTFDILPAIIIEYQI